MLVFFSILCFREVERVERQKKIVISQEIVLNRRQFQFTLEFQSKSCTNWTKKKKQTRIFNLNFCRAKKRINEIGRRKKHPFFLFFEDKKMDLVNLTSMRKHSTDNYQWFVVYQCRIYKWAFWGWWKMDKGRKFKDDGRKIWSKSKRKTVYRKLYC